jgi:hypothetical protein
MVVSYYTAKMYRQAEDFPFVGLVSPTSAVGLYPLRSAMDIYKKAMAVCAAIATFSGTTYIFLQGAELELVKRVKASIAASVQRVESTVEEK